MSVFELSETLESINGGAARYDMQQLYPISGNIAANTVVGQGQASGLTTFQFQSGSSNWWSPCNSYFSLILKFVEGGAVPTDAIAYADNFVCTLFSQLQSYINSQPLDTINTPHLIDTALTYSNAKANFIKTWGSLTRVGEPLTTRVRNLQQNSGLVEVIFRPPLSLMDVKLMPPGAQFRIDFNWAANGINAFESIYRSVTWNTSFSDTTANTVSIGVQGFSFYMASVNPGNNVPLPDRGVIDLSPCTATQYFCNTGNTLKQNITLPSTTNKILIGFQDINPCIVTTSPPNDNICGVGNGYNPATSFSAIFTTASATTNNQTFTTNTTSLQQLWLSLPELGIQEPQPIYTFSGIQDFARAYSDFCHITQGTYTQCEGSIPFGSFATNAGVTIIAPSSMGTGTAFQYGDINNPQQYPYIAAGSNNVPPSNVYNQTARWGWLGRIPGPIFAFPVVRPEGKTVSVGTLNAMFNTTVISVAATVMSEYCMAIVLEHQGNGYYKYSLVEGV